MAAAVQETSSTTIWVNLDFFVCAGCCCCSKLDNRVEESESCIGYCVFTDEKDRMCWQSSGECSFMIKL